MIEKKKSLRTGATQLYLCLTLIQTIIDINDFSNNIYLELAKQKIHEAIRFYDEEIRILKLEENNDEI